MNNEKSLSLKEMEERLSLLTNELSGKELQIEGLRKNAEEICSKYRGELGELRKKIMERICSSRGID